MLCGAAASEPMQSELQASDAETLQDHVELRQMLRLPPSPQLLRSFCGGEVPDHCTHQPPYAIGLHQDVLGRGVAGHPPCLREPDADQPVHALVATLLVFCEAVQIAPAQAPRLCWSQEAVKGEQREETEHGPP